MSRLLERLGFAARDRVAIVHADDIGMCHAANEGAFEALANGPATCGSVMVPCPWFREAAALARARPELDLGVHLTLNSEWAHYRWGPVAPVGAVPSLLDPEGCLPRTTLETLQRARPEQVEIELRAQVERALEAGIDVTHLDSHMGTCFFPQFAELLVRLARDYRLPVFVPPPHPELLAARGLSQAAPFLGRLASAMAEIGVPILDGFDADSLGFARGEGVAHNRARLGKLGPGVHYLICHPAKDGEELSAVTPESAHARDFERGFYGGEGGRRALEELGIRRIGMRVLRELMRAD